MGEVYYLNRNWRFNDCFEGSFLIEPMSTGKPVEIPHIFHETSYNYINKDKLRAKCALLPERNGGAKGFF